jgi:hypothetical protein
MDMRTTTLALLVLIITAGCNKPTEPECRNAIANMRRLLETDKVINSSDVESAVRRCRGSSTKKSVKCATDAKSLEELDACGLLPPPKPSSDAPKDDKAPAPPAPEPAAK